MCASFLRTFVSNEAKYYDKCPQRNRPKLSEFLPCKDTDLEIREGTIYVNYKKGFYIRNLHKRKFLLIIGMGLHLVFDPNEISV